MLAIVEMTLHYAYGFIVNQAIYFMALNHYQYGRSLSPILQYGSYLINTNECLKILSIFICIIILTSIFVNRKQMCSLTVTGHITIIYQIPRNNPKTINSVFVLRNLLYTNCIRTSWGPFNQSCQKVVMIIYIQSPVLELDNVLSTMFVYMSKKINNLHMCDYLDITQPVYFSMSIPSRSTFGYQTFCKGFCLESTEINVYQKYEVVSRFTFFRLAYILATQGFAMFHMKITFQINYI